MNPEFKRNLWLQFSWPKILAAPVLLGVVLFGIEASGGITQREVSEGAYWLFHLIMGFWASRQAANAIAEEVVSGTWNAQRMSALRAWQVCWGKILGSTSYAWYCAFLILAVLVWSGKSFEEVGLFTASPFVLSLHLIFSALSGLAMAFLAALLLVRKSAERRRISVSFAQVIGLCFYASLQSGVFIHTVAGPSNTAVKWYGLDINTQFFLIFHAAMAAIWIWIAAWRTLQAELQYRQRPFFFFAFLLFVVVYDYGYSFSSLSWASFWQISSAHFMLLSYLAFFAEAKNPLRYIRWWGLIRKNPKDAFQSIPLWLMAYVASFLAVALLWLYPEEQIVSPLGNNFLSDIYPEKSVPLSLWMSVAVFFVLRDFLFLLWLNFGRWKNPDFVGLLILAIIYWPLSALLKWMGEGDWFVAFARPTIGPSLVFTFAPVAVEIFILVLLLRQRFFHASALKVQHA